LSLFNLRSGLDIGDENDDDDALTGEAGGVRPAVPNGLMLSTKFMIVRIPVVISSSPTLVSIDEIEVNKDG
jgi:hypothetical protein